MHVKICVDCGEEYRPEVAVCADCGGRLEERSDDAPRAKKAPAPMDEAPADEGEAELTDPVLYADRVGELRPPADQLLEAGIDFQLRPSPGAGYGLFVKTDDRERALAACGLLADAGGSGDVKTCPACATALGADATECPECGLAVGFEPDDLP
jgi:hypothetical protein